MTLVCSQCGAPLDVMPGATLATCNYCGVKTQLATHRKPSHPVPPAPGTSPSRVVRMVVLGVAANLAIGAIVAAAVFLKSSEQNILPPPPPPPSISPGSLLSAARQQSSKPAQAGPKSFSHPVCELDANGDGVADLMGLSSSDAASYQPSVVDGATGQLLWASTSASDRPEVACIDERWFVVVEKNFQAEFHDVRNLGAPVRVLLRDQLDEVGMGNGCARIKTNDGSTQGVQLPGGAAVDCKAKLKRSRERPGIIGLTEQRTEIAFAKRTYKLSKRRQGTSILTVEVEDKGKSIWRRELPYAAPTFSSAIAASENSIALWAAQPGEESKGILVGLDAETGDQRYAIPSTLMVSHSVSYFAYNGRYVILQAWSSLEAYEPDTGKLAWKIGR